MTIPRAQQTSRKRPCPICEKADWCFFSEDGNLIFCHRVRDGAAAQARNGAYIHVLDNLQGFNRTKTFSTPQAKLIREKPQSERAPAEQLHNVYSAMLELLTLEEKHRSDLFKRGLSYQVIEANNYKSTPSLFDASQIAFELSQRFDLRGVPGFYQERSAWRMVKSVTNGDFFVPYRNTCRQIHGLQIKILGAKYFWFSSNSYPSGSPIHFINLQSVKDEILITEGALKADIISYFTNSPVVAAAGVNNFGKDFAFHLRKKFPSLRRAILCFDTDLYEKEQVRSALFKLGHELQRAYFVVSVRDWSEEHKGYDDFLNTQTNNHRIGVTA